VGEAQGHRQLLLEVKSQLGRCRTLAKHCDLLVAERPLPDGGPKPLDRLAEGRTGSFSGGDGGRGAVAGALALDQRM
jgi:hypothetical protein